MSIPRLEQDGAVKDVPVWEAEPATEFDVFLKQWALESYKQSLPLLNQFLTLMITLDTALMGGSFLVDDKVLPTAGRLLAFTSLLASLLVAMWGLFPYTGTVDLLNPDSVTEHKSRAIQWKKRRAWWAGGLLAFAFLAALLGMVVRVATA